jgi:hypothetical protein
MSSIATSLQLLCFVHPHSGSLFTLLHLVTSIHLSGALACTLVVRCMLGELIASNRWVHPPACLWCASHVFLRYACRLSFGWASRYISRSARRCCQTAEPALWIHTIVWIHDNFERLSQFPQSRLTIVPLVRLQLLAVSIGECTSRCFLPALAVC